LVTPGASNKSIAIISTNNFEIESKVSEIDVSKLATSSKGEVHFDSFGLDKKFEIIVSNISPAGIISDGVPTFKTIFTFLQNNENIRSGMTANIEIITRDLSSVVAIPAKYIVNQSGVKKVKVKNSNNAIVTKEIVTGIVGRGGQVEIVSGLEEGEVVVYAE